VPNSIGTDHVFYPKEAVPARSAGKLFIRDAIQRGQLTGSQRFIDEIAVQRGTRIERRGQGRPKHAPLGKK
jgi:putative transposase